MKPTHQQHNDFLAHKPLPDVAFEHNDSVVVIGGFREGTLGVIISVEELGNDPTYLVELDTGQDSYLLQSLLRTHVA